MRASHALSVVRESRIAASLRDRSERRRRVPWPSGGSSGGRVAIVVVNHDTRRLISQLVFSLYRVLGGDQFALLVIVDNASTDGSLTMLQALDEAGLIQLIANRRQRYHGSGLNQAVSWLASRQARVPAAERIDYVWALDSDTLVLRRETVRDALATFRESGAAVIGEPWGAREGHGEFPLCSLMFDPVQVWQRRLAPFADDGAPERRFLESVSAARLRTVPFPFLHHSYVLHLGSGTLRSVAGSAEWRNRFYGWALGHSELTYTHHPLGPRLYDALDVAFEREVPGGDPASLVSACRRQQLLTLPEARPLPPREELQRLYQQGVDLVEYLLPRGM